MGAQEAVRRSRSFTCALCETLDIQTSPAKVDARWIVPLFSWYESQFDADDSGDHDSLGGWADFYLCKWPTAIGQVCDFFLRLNEPRLLSYDGPVISFSHFLPRRDLLPAVERLRFKGLPKVAGCAGLDKQIRALKSACISLGIATSVATVSLTAYGTFRTHCAIRVSVQLLLFR
jgi:hypothetical protein